MHWFQQEQVYPIHCVENDTTFVVMVEFGIVTFPLSCYMHEDVG